ncbi:MAG: CpsD/CapB family tyrosine-protein kinase [Intestinibacter bartlettii]|uniref:CpsD/CapB family tyrosine-protein kinase n=1 Tax=Intestinibacter bartlettii TaxID=261299 RepID=UPI0026ED66A7|nr:CpsD/CapB family tyrosine-protein kinase [Intestinibacter bartlettii]MDO5011045.1 CpsD/CapB family tyrosine-protein kinase [Intestinibacter bartlettii]
MRAEYNQGNFEINESYREVRTYLGINKDTKTILITSAEMDEGKTTIACNLASCFAELEDTKVLLIDCDFAKRGVSRYFNIENARGISDIVFGNNKVEECIQKVGFLDVITSGARPSNTSILLNSQSMKNVIKKFREEYDYVFIDSPPISRMNDACIITQYVDGTLIVNAVGAIDSRIAKITLEKLNKVGANILGVILNKFKPEKNEYYSYYSYGYEDSKRKLFGSKKHKKHKKHKE